MPIGAAVAIASGFYKMRQAQKELNRLKAGGRPEYKIPEGVQQNLTQAQMQALEGLPEDQVRQYVENTQRAGQFGLGQLQSGGRGLRGVSGVVQQQMDASKELLSMDAQARQQNQAGLAQARLTQGSFQERAFDINQMQPYLQDSTLARKMMMYGENQMMGGINAGEQEGMNAMSQFLSSKSGGGGLAGSSSGGGQGPGLNK